MGLYLFIISKRCFFSSSRRPRQLFNVPIIVFHSHANQNMNRLLFVVSFLCGRAALASILLSIAVVVVPPPALIRHRAGSSSLLLLPPAHHHHHHTTSTTTTAGHSWRPLRWRHRVVVLLPREIMPPHDLSRVRRQASSTHRREVIFFCNMLQRLTLACWVRRLGDTRNRSCDSSTLHGNESTGHPHPLEVRF